ncbi:MAG: hypothetical protein RL411_952 [Bacteroidota bacterium]
MTLFVQQTNADLVNGGFEDYQVFGYDFVNGSSPTINWATTAPDNLLEIWENGFFGVLSYEGNSFAELNANYASTLYQDINGLGDLNSINWHFAHRGRYGTDLMRLTITDAGSDQMFGNGNDTILFQQEFSAGNMGWEVNYGTITSIGNLTRFSFEAVSAVGGSTQGNFIDYVGFGQNAIPGPGAFSLLAISAILFNRRKR